MKDTLMAALLLNRYEPMAPHHIGALRELLGDATDDELTALIQTGHRCQHKRTESSIERNCYPYGDDVTSTVCLDCGERVSVDNVTL